MRWAATLRNRLVLAEPGNRTGRKRLTETCRQLAFPTELSLRRNMRLAAAPERATGRAHAWGWRRRLSSSAPCPLAPPRYTLAARLVPDRVPPEPVMPARGPGDAGGRNLIRIGSKVVVHEAGVPGPAWVTLRLPRAALLAALAGRGFPQPPAVLVTGRAALVPLFLGLFETPPADHAITIQRTIRPRGPAADRPPSLPGRALPPAAPRP